MKLDRARHHAVCISVCRSGPATTVPARQQLRSASVVSECIAESRTPADQADCRDVATGMQGAGGRARAAKGRSCPPACQAPQLACPAVRLMETGQIWQQGGWRCVEWFNSAAPAVADAPPRGGNMRYG